MRTKSIKIQGSEVDAVLMCGGKGFKVYSHGDMLILSIGRKLLGFIEKDIQYQTIIDYVNLKYHNINLQDGIKTNFMELVKKVKL